MTTGELIRILSHWCPDTTISISHPAEGELNIGHLVPWEENTEYGESAGNAEVFLTVMEE